MKEEEIEDEIMKRKNGRKEYMKLEIECIDKDFEKGKGKKVEGGK